MDEAKWTVVDVGIGQMQEMRSLFQRVFGHVLSEQMWSWKYDQGRGFGVGACAPSGELLAHYGGTLRTVCFFGVEHLAIQIGDVMVAREGRAALAHKGPFGMVVQGFLARHVGQPIGPILGFGFPNARHMRLGERLGHYSQVEKISELSWSLAARTSQSMLLRSKSFVEAIDWNASFCSATLDKLWRRMSSGLNGVVVPRRDASWWLHRYATHPEHQYLCFWVRSFWTRRIVGAIALRPHFGSAKPVGGTALTWELMDWIAPVGLTELVLQSAMEVVRTHNGTTLMGWFSATASKGFITPPTSANEVCTAGVTVPDNGVSFPLASSASLSLDSFVERWWLTGGDTDFR